MQTCSGMSVAISLSECLYAMRSTNGIKMWKPARSVLP
jgi:hypothetical protein